MNLNHYLSGKAGIQEWFLRQKNRNILESISLISVTTHIPVIVCAFYIGEISGWPEEVLTTIERLKASYGYKEIEGIPEGFPKKEQL